jgi:hypothetical protein
MSFNTIPKLSCSILITPCSLFAEIVHPELEAVTEEAKSDPGPAALKVNWPKL